MLRYTIVLTPEPDGSVINVTVPAMPGVLTWGHTIDGALASAREAIELHLESYVERGLPFPRDRRQKGRQVFTVDVRPPARAARRSA
jgi:antitoxin HicB